MSDSLSDRLGLILGVVFGVVGLVLAVVLVFIKIRKRQQGDAELASGSFRGTAVLNKEYLAGKIVPFGAPVAEFPSHFRA